MAIAGDQPEHDFEIARLEGFPHPIANARRIVACVNACAGIDTELLEDFVKSGHILSINYGTYA